MRLLPASLRSDAWGWCVVAVDPAAPRDERTAQGRAAAREALRQVGVDPAGAPLLPGPGGAPVWPSGVLGSIAHTEGWSAAAVVRPRATRRPVVALGLDAEARRPLDPGVLAVVASRQERDMLSRRAARAPDIPWALALVTAKEAAYKAGFHLSGQRLDWDAVEVRLGRSGFSAVVRPDRHPAVRVRGRMRVHPSVVVALGVVHGSRGGRTRRSAAG